MKQHFFPVIIIAASMWSCCTEFRILSTDLPPQVMANFQLQYPGAKDVEWEVEKEDGRLTFEAEFKENGKKKEVYFKPDGTILKEE
jgi:hypothetical protein